MKHPSQDDFEVRIHKGGGVVVIFKPTQCHYSYWFLADGTLDAPVVTGNAGDYFASEVTDLASQIAYATARTG
jgi:hypothetical protein